jgi:hypothetical protein
MLQPPDFVIFQNDMERYRVIQSMEKMRQNPAKAVKGMLPPKAS